MTTLRSETLLILRTLIGKGKVDECGADCDKVNRGLAHRTGRRRKGGRKKGIGRRRCEHRLAVGRTRTPLLDVRGPNVDAVNLYLARRTEAAEAAAPSARERGAVRGE